MKEQANTGPAGASGSDWGGETPQALLARTDLTTQDKIEILHQWELDLRERMVAEQENMPATEPPAFTLDQVLQALDALGAGPDAHPVPTTHG